VKRWAGDGVAILIVAPLVAVVLAPGWFVGHDDLHPVRLFEQDLMIRSGQFPVRWYPDIAGGYGSPHPQFYAPFFYLLAQIFLFAGLPLTASLKGAVAVVVIATSIAMYRLVRAFFGEEGGLVAAAAVSYAPYHLLDLFVRTAFSELTVFLFVPLVLLGFHRLAERPGPGRIAAAGAALAGLCLGHTITLLLVPPLLVSFLLLLAWRERFDAKVLRAAAAAAILGFALAGFFLVPLVAEQGAIDTSVFSTGYFTFDRHFVAPVQLLWSRWGYGLSAEGAADAMSFRLGVLQILGCLAAALLAPRIRRASAPGAAMTLYMGILSAAGVFMALRVSAPIWRAVQPLQFVQFPWRFLVLPAIGTAFLAGAAVSAVTRGGAGRAWVPALCTALIIAASAGMLGFEKRIPIETIRFRRVSSPERRADLSRDRVPGGLTRGFVRNQFLDWPDHLPPGAFPPPPDEGDLDRPRAEVVGGRATLTVEERGPVRYHLSVRAEEPSLVRLNVYRFPGWRWLLDGRPAPWGPAPADRPALTLEVPAGLHEVEAAYVRTAPRWAGDILSLASIGVLTALAAVAMKRREDSLSS